LAAALLGRLHSGDIAVLEEVFEQACHQFTASEVGYAVVPHLVELTEQRPSREFRVKALSIAGSVAAARFAHSRSSHAVPAQLTDDYERANLRALSLAATMLGSESLSPRESGLLIAVVAALRRLDDLALFILLSDGDPALSCPACGEPIQFGEE
jgi:hypothetical protein